MKVFVAGATGAIGRPLIKNLTLAGHTTFGMVRSQDSSASLSDFGAEPVIADALDAQSVSAGVAKVRPDVIINELTSLPKHYTPTDMKTAAERDARVRLEGNKNLIAAALQTSVRRFLVQSTGFWYAPGEGLADVRALGCAPGPYNIVDDNPSEQRVWLTAFARNYGALDPPHISEQQALQAAGPDAVYYATRLRGASNAKAKRELGFRPRPLQWLTNTLRNS